MTDRLRETAERMADAVAAYKNIGSAPTDLSAAIDRLASIMQEIFAAEADLRAALAEKRVPLTVHPTDIYAFAGWLTARPGTMLVGSSHDAAYMADAVGEYLRLFPDRFRAHGIGGKDE